MDDEPDQPDGPGSAALVIYTVIWCLTVLPMLGIYALGNGMFGRSVLWVPLDVVRKAIAFDPIAVAIILLSLPFLVIPFFLMGRGRRR